MQAGRCKVGFTWWTHEEGDEVQSGLLTWEEEKKKKGWGFSLLYFFVFAGRKNGWAICGYGESE